MKSYQTQYREQMQRYTHEELTSDQEYYCDTLIQDLLSIIGEKHRWVRVVLKVGRIVAIIVQLAIARRLL